MKKHTQKTYFQVNVVNGGPHVLKHGFVRHEQITQFNSRRCSIVQ